MGDVGGITRFLLTVFHFKWNPDLQAKCHCHCSPCTHGAFITHKVFFEAVEEWVILLKKEGVSIWVLICLSCHRRRRAHRLIPRVYVFRSMSMHELWLIKWHRSGDLLKLPRRRDIGSEWTNRCWHFHNDYDSTHYGSRDQRSYKAEDFISGWSKSAPQNRSWTDLEGRPVDSLHRDHLFTESGRIRVF